MVDHYSSASGPSQQFQQANAPGSWLRLHRGDVIWLKLAQNLSAPGALAEIANKTRPFIILQQKAELKLDQQGICIDPQAVLGIDCTSQETLVEARPHVAYKIRPHAEKTTYALLDSIRTTSCLGARVSKAYALNADQRDELTEGLDTVLQPEKKFFLKSIFNAKRGCMPGDVWSITLPGEEGSGQLTREADAMVLLRRGQFFMDEDDKGQTRFTPYLVAVFPGRFKAPEMRGLGWEDVQLLAVHERSFLYQVGRLSGETVGIILNTLRQRAGVESIVYQQPAIRSMMLRMAGLLSFPRLAGGRIP